MTETPSQYCTHPADLAHKQSRHTRISCSISRNLAYNVSDFQEILTFNIMRLFFRLLFMLGSTLYRTTHATTTDGDKCRFPQKSLDRIMSSWSTSNKTMGYDPGRYVQTDTRLSNDNFTVPVPHTNIEIVANFDYEKPLSPAELRRALDEARRRANTHPYDERVDIKEIDFDFSNVNVWIWLHRNDLKWSMVCDILYGIQFVFVTSQCYYAMNLVAFEQADGEPQKSLIATGALTRSIDHTNLQ